MEPARYITKHYSGRHKRAGCSKLVALNKSIMNSEFIAASAEFGDDPSEGLGKPEPLKHKLSDLWSRRLSQKDRIIYKYDNQSIYIFAIGGHYES